MNYSTIWRFGTSCALLTLAMACSSDDGGDETGSAGDGSGGSPQSTAQGGKTTRGGSSARGGSTARGGASTTSAGGSTAPASTTTAGTTSLGGSSATSSTTAGGTSSVGGTTSVGGSTAAGGTTAKTTTSAGGATTVGGSTTVTTTSVGGSTTLGTTSVGGATTVGGTTSVGGSSTVGGTTATGGTTSDTGGTTATGGTSDAGGTTATGGTSDVGGTTAAGGTTSATATGPTAAETFAAAAKFPAIAATNVPVDAWLSLTFDAPPTLGTSGRIYIRKVSDDSQVDVINMADSPDTVRIDNAALNGTTRFDASTSSQASLAAFGFNTTANFLGNEYPTYQRTTGRIRIVKYRPVRVVGNQIRIYPHDGAMQYDTQYYVTIDSSAATGNLGGVPFGGVAGKTMWTFTTKATAPTGTPLTVNADGTSGNFMTVQGALNAVPGGNTTAVTITVANGVYEELLSSYNKSVIINGQSNTGTVVQYENYESFITGTGSFPASSYPNDVNGVAYTTANGDAYRVPVTGTLTSGGRSVYMAGMTGSSTMEINNITFRNTHVRAATAGMKNAAEALYFNGGSGNKLISRESIYISSDSTLQLKGLSWFYNCFIAGNADFIWGTPVVSLFEDCEIQSRVDPTGATGPSVLLDRTVAGNGGFIFLGSAFTAESGVASKSVYLARTGGTTTSNDHITFSNCSMGAHVNGAVFKDTPAITTATSVSGIRYFGLTDDVAIAPWDTSTLTGKPAFYPLTDAENSNLYGSRGTIFGSNPVTYSGASYASSVWTLSTTY